MLIATHDGSFHADEVFAVAALGLLGDAVGVVRTRDRGKIERADVRVDVGFRDDASTGDFDHHQRDFASTRENGVRYASFGLVWRVYGARVCEGDQDVADAVDQTLVQAVDANDTGQRVTQSLIDGVRPMTINGIIGGFNARWDETLTPEQEQALDALTRSIVNKVAHGPISELRRQASHPDGHFLIATIRKVFRLGD